MVLTSSGILKSWHERSGKASYGTKHAEKTIHAVEVLNLAKAGDVRAVKIIRHRAEIIADIIVNLSLILNPGLILLSGEIGGHPVLIDFVRQQLEGSEFAVTKISSGTPGNRAVLWGAISLALEAIPSVLLPQPEM